MAKVVNENTPYFKRISQFTVDELLKEAKKNLKLMDKHNIHYRDGANLYTIKNRLKQEEIDFDNLSGLDGDLLYLLNVQLNEFLEDFIGD